ncbi:hypothetical protein J2D73_05035 [Acetobacter sacchari]|uniref:Uncharacterized protein n=1 Tax=Acetobacter sacchari TaxID=2661687 RepID=A0ABS3LTC7_9PROT|nr:hypothetical protein [Acetobacter sacchari]MBO1359161.1 hypothetical protein [Acetobacter sacchari]
MALSLTFGQRLSATEAEPLLDEADPRTLTADKAHGADLFITNLEPDRSRRLFRQEQTGAINGKSNFPLYKSRNTTERFFPG